MNRKNKGFTLVELLAVIVILGIVLTIATTSVLRSKKDTIQKTKYMAAKEIVEIAEAYMIANNINSVDFRKLCVDGYLESNVTDPLTGKNVDSCDVLKGKIRRKLDNDAENVDYKPNNNGAYVFNDLAFDLSEDVVSEGSVQVTEIKTYIDSLELTKNNSSKIKLDLSPANATNKDVEWKSSNANIVTVDDTGIITAKGDGEAKITIIAKGENGDTKVEKTINVVVLPKTDSNVYATSLALSSGDISFLINTSNKTKKITATVSPQNTTNKTIAWKSSKTNVATVDSNGTITAKSAGKTTISASTSNGIIKKINVIVRQNVVVIVGASQVYRFDKYLGSSGSFDPGYSYEKGNNTYSLSDKSLVYVYQSGSNIRWQYGEGMEKTINTLKSNNYDKEYTNFYIVYPLSGNEIKKFSCDDIRNKKATIGGKTIEIADFVKGYNNSIDTIKNDGGYKNVKKGYVISMHPVKIKAGISSEVVANTNDAACDSGKRSNYKYFLFNSKVKSEIDGGGYDNLKYIPLFVDIMDVNGATTYKKTSFSYKQLTDPLTGESINYDTEQDGIHWNGPTSRAYLKMMLDRVSGL